NTLYVATTRTRRHLYITAPGKKGDGEISALLASDLLLEVLPGIAGELDVEFSDGIRLGTATETDTPRGQEPPQAGWSFSHYPASTRMKEALARPEIQTELDVARLDVAKRQGQLLHKLMAETAATTELEAYADVLQAEGWLRSEERSEVLALAQATWNHPQLAHWFSGEYEHWNERDVILPDGRTLRPDKILVRPDETIVLDFKFTQHESEAHLKQVADYQLVLREMGMPHVKGYVYYGMLEKLVEV